MKIPATADDIRRELASLVADSGSQAKLAKTIDCSPALLSEVIRGTREPAGKILDYLGLKRQVRYVR